MTKRILLLTVTILTALSIGLAYGATPTATANGLLVNYFVNANTEGAPDGTVQLTNTGATGGNIYAAIYVFYPDEEMAECCACSLTPDDLRTLSINGNLTSNTLTSSPLNNGTITIIPSSSASPTTITPSGQISAWGTHVLTTGVTEEEFQSANLSVKEITSLENQCNAIFLDGSGHGVCTCGSGS